jgi:hypothetical protein
MVSKASDDFPEPLRPVMTVSEFRGIRTLTFLRLCCRAPETVISSSILVFFKESRFNASAQRSGIDPGIIET